METRGISSLNGESQELITSLPRPLAAFCGVGNPQSFFEHLKRAGYTLAFTRFFADHRAYDQQDADTLVRDAKRLGARGLITTAKDAVKLQGLNFLLPGYVVEVEIAIEQSDNLIAMLDRTLSLQRLNS